MPNRRRPDPRRFTACPAQDFTPGKPADDCDCDLCRSNLHHLKCPLPKQVLQRGHTTEHNEGWLERSVATSGRRTKGRITGLPASVTVQAELDALAVMRAGLELGANAGTGSAGGHATARTADVLACNAAAIKAVLATLQRGQGSSSSRMLGAGRALDDDEWQAWQVGR